jgi:hypothetical protein
VVVVQVVQVLLLQLLLVEEQVEVVLPSYVNGYQHPYYHLQLA